MRSKKSIAMTMDALSQWLPGSFVLTYDELSKFKDLDELLGERKQAVILYLMKEHFGHFTCIFRRGRSIEVFDSYGVKPDDELDYIPNYFRRTSGQQVAHLSYLLYHSPYTIHFNDHKLQKRDPSVATCGPHCIVRLAYKHLSCDRYAAMLQASGDPDAVVAQAVLGEM